MESTVKAQEDILIGNLSYKLAPGASYVTNRRSVSFFPQAGNYYSPNGVRVIKFQLTGDDWLDPDSFRIMFNIVNEETDTNKSLRILGLAHTFFRRVRVIAGGQIIHDIDEYNRVHEMFQILSSKEKRVNDQIENGCLPYYDIQREYERPEGGVPFGSKVINPGAITSLENAFVVPTTDTQYPGVSAGKFARVAFKPLLGILQTGKYLPLNKMGGMQIELELVSDATEVLIAPIDTTGFFNTTNCGTKWHIENVQVKCDVCSLDSALENEYTEYLLKGGALTINYGNMVSMTNLISGPKHTSTISRSFTRLKSVFASMDGLGLGEGSQIFFRKPWNDFFHPSDNFTVVRPEDEVEYQLQLGSKLTPEYPITSIAEAFTHLRKCLGISSSSFHSLDITPNEYKSHKFIMALDLERVPQSSFTGQYTKAGDLLSFNLKYQPDTSGGDPKSLHIVLHNDSLLEIRDSGISVYE